MRTGRAFIPRRIVGQVLAVAVVAATAMVAGAGSAGASQASSHPAKSSGFYIAVSGPAFDPHRTYSYAEVTKMAQDANGSVVGGPSVVQPHDVASGYILWNPGYKRSAYIYDSSWGNLTYEYCNGSCQILEQWQSQVHLWVQGGTAKSWKITMNAKHISGTYNAYFDYWYACAINVSGSPDHYCSTGHGADPSPESGPMNPGDTIFRYFERNSYSNTEYGMVGITAHFPNSFSATNKDRLADVCVKASSASLCAVTGTGTSPSTHRW